VAVYVWPVGARAGSAGVYICYSAHVAAMAPNTNIGAAHPVAMGGEMDSVMSDKITNDAVASIKAMAERYGRNAEWAEESIRASVSITSSEALEIGVIDLIAEDVDDLLEKINGREVKTVHGTEVLRINRPIKEEIKKTFWQGILDILVNPNVVFALLAIGGLGITMEIYNPGSIFPGVIGGICIILAAYGIRILPINFAGLLLIFLAILLFIMEIKIVSHGMLTIGGIVSLVLGGIFLIDTADPQLKVSLTVIITTAVVIGLFVIFAFYFVYKARVSQPATGQEGLVGKTAEVRTKIDGSGYIYLNGELWEASADEVIEKGEQVEVIEVENLKMKVKKKS
jgi:membrane-bound serine protease (ClpP class)